MASWSLLHSGQWIMPTRIFPFRGTHACLEDVLSHPRLHHSGQVRKQSDPVSRTLWPVRAVGRRTVHRSMLQVMENHNFSFIPQSAQRT